MTSEKKGLIVLLGLLSCVVLMTAGVIRNYNSRSQDPARSSGEQATPQIIRELLNESAQFFTREQYPEAEQTLRRVLSLDRDNIVAMRMLGNVYFLSGKYFEASEVFRAVLAKHPKDPVAHANLGETMIRMQWYEAGIRELLTARAIDPNQPGIDLSLSRAYEELGDTVQAQFFRRLASERAVRQRDVPPPQENQNTESISAESPEPNHESN